MENLGLIASIVYISLYFMLVWLRPSVLFEPGGGLRQFGLGNSRTTIVPLWLVAILLGILSFFGVKYCQLNVLTRR